jgi:SAM-dependent methyltransferase
MIEEIIKNKNLDASKLKINIGSGNATYKNCINLELEPNPEVDADIYGDITKGFPFIPKETFKDALLIHVIEHINRNLHQFVFDEIWRILKPNGRIIVGFPDALEVMRRFIDNKFGGRWSVYNFCLYGRQSRKGDYHVTAVTVEDIKDKLFSSGFRDVKTLQHTVNVTMTARKGEKLNGYL